MRKSTTMAAGLAASLAVGPVAALAGATSAPADAEVYFVQPADGATVSSPVHIVFGLKGMGVAPAGVEKENTGHHHLPIDRPPFGEGEGDETGAPLPADDHHKHFGGGQTEAEIELSPGTHTLQLVLGDQNHVPHDPMVASDVIMIEVK